MLYRDDDRQPNPKELGPRYVDEFLDYYDLNRDMNIIAFGLNCSEPEEMLDSFESIFGEINAEEKNDKVMVVQ